MKKVLSELGNVATDRPDDYVKFIEQYNRPLKEGLYSDFANRDALLDLIRVKSTKAEGWTSLKDVKSRMQEGQKGHLLHHGRSGERAAHLAAARDL